jgi:hypothetical protein
MVLCFFGSFCTGTGKKWGASARSLAISLPTKNEAALRAASSLSPGGRMLFIDLLWSLCVLMCFFLYRLVMNDLILKRWGNFTGGVHYTAEQKALGALPYKGEDWEQADHAFMRAHEAATNFQIATYKHWHISVYPPDVSTKHRDHFRYGYRKQLEHYHTEHQFWTFPLFTKFLTLRIG